MVSSVDPSFITTSPVNKQGMKNTLQIIKDEITALQNSLGVIEATPGTVPVGATVEWDEAFTEPTGWMIADGRAISRTTYSAYYARVTTTYGPGDGVTTFNIPTLPEIAPGRRQMVYVAGSVDDTPGTFSLPWQLTFLPTKNEQPVSNGATFDTRNNHPVLDFDSNTEESAVFTEVLPVSYGGRGITVFIYSTCDTTSGTVGWKVSIERCAAGGQDIDSDGFGSANTVTAVAVPATSGQILVQSVDIANGTAMDSLSGNDLFRIKISRDTANDTAAADAQLVAAMMVEQS